MTRVLAVGLLLVTTAPAGPVAAQNIELWIPLIQNDRLQDQISLDVLYQQSQVSVHVFRRSTPEGPSLPAIAIQAWVLKSDGTVLRRRDPTKPTRSDGTNSQSSTDWVTVLPFEPARVEDLAAVVVSVDGALFVRRILQQPAN